MASYSTKSLSGLTSPEGNNSQSTTTSRAGVAILKLVGPGPYPPKKVVGPGPGFTLFPPKSGGARAQPAHTATPALYEELSRIIFYIRNVSNNTRMTLEFVSCSEIVIHK